MHPLRQFPDLVVSLQPALRHCDGCDRSQDSDSTIQLKKCGGCSTALYCSKRCQKSAWPHHKLLCRVSLTVSLVPTKAGEIPADFSSLGYPSFPALARAFQEFSEAHEWAFRSLAKAYVLLDGGIEWSQNPPKRLLLLLVPAATSGTRERNPARAFRFTSFFFTPLDETLTSNPVKVYDPERQERLHKRAVDMWHWHPDYVGLLPVMFVIDGLNISFERYIPQFRPVNLPTPMPLLADDNGKKTVSEDMVLLSGASINVGIPFRPVEESGQEGMMLALPGQFVRGQSGSWSWTALFSRWEDYTRGVHRDLDEMFDTFPLRNAPGDTITAFNFL